MTLSGLGTPNVEGSQTLTYHWTVSDASDDELVTVGPTFLTNANQAEATFTVMKRKHMTDRSALGTTTTRSSSSSSSPTETRNRTQTP